jgi:hypothetical protein
MLLSLTQTSHRMQLRKAFRLVHTSVMWNVKYEVYICMHSIYAHKPTHYSHGWGPKCCQTGSQRSKEKCVQTCTKDQRKGVDKRGAGVRVRVVC